MSTRRDFIMLLGGAAAAWPLAARAQAKVYAIGILETVPRAQNQANFAALLNGLRELGYVEGQNLRIDYRSADGQGERFPELVAELVRNRVDLIVTPERTIWPGHPKRPEKLHLDNLSPDQIAAIPVLAQRLSR